MKEEGYSFNIKIDENPLNETKKLRDSKKSLENEIYKLNNKINFYCTVLDNLYEAIIMIDKNSIIRYINPAYTRLLGIKREKLLHKPLKNIEPKANLLTVLKTGRPIIEQRAHIETLDVEVIHTTVPLLDNEGNTAGALAAMRDITKVLQLTKRLETSEAFIKYLEKEVARNNKAKTYNTIFPQIIGESESLKKSLNRVELVAPKEMTVLITGESGTGKELIAKAIHYNSPRRTMPLIKINCTTLPENLLESELFGYEKGAFTGAKNKGKPGKFEIANGGTIFLDEIGELTLNMQSKFLRVLQEREIERVGGNQVIKIDVRILTATNRDLQQMVAEKMFREDLFYRLNVIQIEVPPLRDRKKDIPLLAEHFLQKYTDRKIIISKEVYQIFRKYSWPGNIREIENVIQHILVMIEENIHIVLPRHLPQYIYQERAENIQEQREYVTINRMASLKKMIKEVEKKAITEALHICETKTEAIELLGISRKSFYQKIKQYKIY